MDLELDFDPQSVCRICLSSDAKLVNLFASTVVDGYLTAVPEMILSCLDLKVHNKDRLPGKLCNTCKTDVTSFYVFKQKSKRTDQILRTMIPAEVPPIDDQVPAAVVVETVAKTPEVPTQHAAVVVDDKPPVKEPPLQSVSTIGCEFCEQSFASESALSAHCMEKHAAADDAEDDDRLTTDDQHETTDLLSILTAEPRAKQTTSAVEEASPMPADDQHSELLETIGKFEVESVHEDDNDDDVEDDMDEGSHMDEYILSTANEEDIENRGNESFGEEEHLAMEFDLIDGDTTTAAVEPTSDLGSLVHVCPECDQCFDSTDDLDAHLLSEHQLYHCSICTLTMTRESTWRHHRKNCAVEWLTPRSEQGDEVVSSIAMDEIDDHDDDDQSFQMPDEPPPRKRRRRTTTVTSTATSVRRPSTKDTTKQDQLLSCEVCDKEFTRQTRFDQHMRMHESMTVINTYLVFHPCHACRTIFAHGDDLLRHQRLQHGAAGEDGDLDGGAIMSRRKAIVKAEMPPGEGNEVDDDDIIADDDYTDYQFLDDDGYESGEYKCGECDQVFGSSQETKYHVVTHLEGFECPQADCGCQYEQFLHFCRHMINKHINGETHRCQYCGDEHATFDEKQEHIKNSCLERKHACTHCDKKFFSRKALNNHLAWSKGKRFKCDHCGKMFTQPGELTLHSRIHTDERPFVCTICGSAYKTSSMRAAHMDTHIQGKTFSCKICDVKLQSRTSYRNHMSRHTKEKKHECVYCQKRFFTRYHVQQHTSKVHKEDVIADSVEILLDNLDEELTHDKDDL